MKPKSILIKHQTKKFSKEFMEDGVLCKMIVKIQHDDNCGNGHNSFSVTASLYDRDRSNGEPYITLRTGKKRWLGSCGCIHEDIAKHFPELKKYIKWHLSSTEEPMHYVANSLYWLGRKGYCNGKPGSPPNYEYFKSTAVWEDAPPMEELELLSDEGITKLLTDRLENLLIEFKKAVEKLGMEY